jgi:hypothetical protein
MSWQSACVTPSEAESSVSRHAVVVRYPICCHSAVDIMAVMAFESCRPPLCYSKKISYPMTGCGGLCVRCRRLHIVLTVGSQMAVRLSALRTGRTLLPERSGTHFY